MMPQKAPRDAHELWKRIGLEELRQALIKVSFLTQRFEKTLADLPKCDECAKVTLLDQIRETGNQLGSEVVSLVALAETLKEAVATAEKTQEELLKNCPNPCSCPKGECSCHD